MTTESAAFARNVKTIYRYLRPWGSNSRRGTTTGITFAIELDYTARMIRYSVAICNGDVFERSVGRELAHERLWTQNFIVPMPAPMPTPWVARAGLVETVILPSIRARAAASKHSQPRPLGMEPLCAVAAIMDAVEKTG